MGKSFFPIKIKYADNNEEKVVPHPSCIDSGRGFYVLELNVKTERKYNGGIL